jgi:hypothetical protein
VEFVATEETGGQALPKPGDFILKDVRKWRDVIKTPDLSGVNWEEVVKKDIENLKIDRNETAFILNAGGGGFMFWGSAYGPPGPLLTNKRTWMTNEYEKWREAPYK